MKPQQYQSSNTQIQHLVIWIKSKTLDGFLLLWYLNWGKCYQVLSVVAISMRIILQIPEQTWKNCKRALIRVFWWSIKHYISTQTRLYIAECHLFIPNFYTNIITPRFLSSTCEFIFWLPLLSEVDGTLHGWGWELDLKLCIIQVTLPQSIIYW